jgi:iron complex transport system substrate-binding protein
VVCLSTTHVGFISQLGETGSIIGLSNPGLINDPDVRKGIKNGSITDIGYDAALNFELLLQLKPNVVFAYIVGPEMAPLQAKLAEFGIPLVMVAEYLEENALAKTEWIKFFGCFYNKLPQAEAYYRDEVQRYDSVRNLFQSKMHTVVMTGFPWKDVWYVPGNTSYMVQLIKDAGGKYLFDEVIGRESQPFAIEYISQKAVQSEIWINAGVAGKLVDITSGDARLANIQAFKNKKVFNNNKRQTPDGGSDFFESGVVNPHLILKDLITIFNVDSVTNDQLYYYQKLN